MARFLHKLNIVTSKTPNAEGTSSSSCQIIHPFYHSLSRSLFPLRPPSTLSNPPFKTVLSIDSSHGHHGHHLGCVDGSSRGLRRTRRTRRGSRRRSRWWRRTPKRSNMRRLKRRRRRASQSSCWRRAESQRRGWRISLGLNLPYGSLRRSRRSRH